MNKTIKIIAGVAFAALVMTAGAGADVDIAKLYPISEKSRGHENIEWSTSYAFHLTDAKKHLPRVLLAGDSICVGYQGRVARRLEGKVNVTYWASSYCVTCRNYLKLLEILLDEAPYDVVHFNNGLHSNHTDIEEYKKGLRAAFKLIKAKQPKAKIVWVSSTPYTDAEKTRKVVALNSAAAAVAAECGITETNDLFALMDPLDRKGWWYDICHFKPNGYDRLADAIAKKVLGLVAGR